MLRLEDIDLDARTVRVARQLYYHGAPRPRLERETYRLGGRFTQGVNLPLS